MPYNVDIAAAYIDTLKCLFIFTKFGVYLRLIQQLYRESNI